MEIKIYSTPTCSYCKMTKEYFTSKDIDFANYDIPSDKTALEEMVKVSGQMGMPVVVGDGKVIVGFDKARIDKLIAAS